MTEDAFLAQLFARLPRVPDSVVIPPGDDCAAVRVGNGLLLLLAVDHVVGERHYLSEGPHAATPEQVGRKLLARNLSDIAAMGGEPTCCLTAVASPVGVGEDWLQRFFSGLLELAAQFNVDLIGGDLTSTPHDRVASLTIVGTVPETEVCRRRGAAPGDRLYATGAFGASLPTGHHLSFTPRCREGRWLAQQRLAKAMIDVSDGLLLDAGRVAKMSGVELRLDVDAVPHRTAETTTEAALTDGEDYELLFAVAADDGARLEREWPFPDTPLRCIGMFAPGPSGQVLDRNGLRFTGFARQGYDHFANRT
ncbi:MAG: thiamine-phosphate kinase [Lentisphaerae bacterium RIFOXYB12_FULL_65_16]|nr:MAG: thiamine-phosphate kinase [Lentisphaerae bacterium RIFOXYA12_64_32]OGV91390.1 MAG: thiamine-phosphate kinase [Lentisphaerae bacterium RIFOXYB12_FULL_65_16]